MKEKSLVIALVCASVVSLAAIFALAKSGQNAAPSAISHEPMTAGAFGVPTVVGDGTEARKYPADFFVAHARLNLVGKAEKGMFDSLAAKRGEVAKELDSLRIENLSVAWKTVKLERHWKLIGNRWVVDGFEAGQSFTAEARSREDAETIARTLMNHGGVLLDSVELKVKEWDRIKRELVMAAGKSALRNVETTAAAVNGKTGRVLFASTHEESSGVNTLRSRFLYGGLLGGGEDDRKNPAIPDSLELSALVEVVVELK